MRELDGVVVEREEAVEGLDEELQQDVSHQQQDEGEVVAGVGAGEEALHGGREGEGR